MPLTPGLAAVVPGFFATGFVAALAAGFCVVVLGAVFVAGDAFFGGISVRCILYAAMGQNKDLFTFLQRSPLAPLPPYWILLLVSST